MGTATDWATVYTSNASTCGARTDGTLWCWGFNGYGQLGTGDITDRLTPTQIGTATDWATVSTTSFSTCATRNDGTLWCWGYNPDGNLGTGDTTYRLTPTQVGTATDWTTVDTGGVAASTCGDVVSNERYSLRRGRYVHHTVLRAGKHVPSLDVLLADDNKTDLSPRF